MKTNLNCQITKTGNNSFELKAGSKTDFFIDNLNSYKVLNAPFYYEEIDYDFEIAALIKPEFSSMYDAGGLFIYEDDDKWVKAAFENTDLGYNSVVSVVTDKLSDDCNGEQISQDSIWIRILRKGDYWSIHYSIEGYVWKMVRYFALKMTRKVNVGIIAQSPIGQGCLVKISDLIIRKNDCKNLRKGE